jgi:hypothetical protein
VRHRRSADAQASYGVVEAAGLPFLHRRNQGEAVANHHPVERRTTHRDPREVLSAEVLALLRACGGLRESDHAVLDRDIADRAPAPPSSGGRTRR